MDPTGMFQMLCKEHNHVDLEPNLQDRKVHLHRQAFAGSLLLKNQRVHQSYMNNIRFKIFKHLTLHIRIHICINSIYSIYMVCFLNGLTHIFGNWI